MKSKSVYIELTEEQKEKLQPLFKKVLEESITKPVLLLAQIHFTCSGEATAVCRVVNHATSIKIQAAMNKNSVGKTVGELQAENALRKARDG